jgi:integrase
MNDDFPSAAAVRATRVNLTERRVAALKPGPAGKRTELRDALVPSLIVRCASRRKVFALHCRFPGAKHPTRRMIGEVGSLSIDDARETARQWLGMIRRGIDPAEEARRAREAERGARAALFGAVAGDFAVRRLAHQRRGRDVARIVSKELVSRWGSRPITGISRRDVLDMVEEIDGRGAPIMAQASFAAARVLFGWARDRGLLEHSPCDGVRVGRIVSRTKAPRQRSLTDAEVRAFWNATMLMPQPWRQAFQLLALTGTRKVEALGARWSEFSGLDGPEPTWTIPAARFKSKTDHLVPLSPAALAVLGSLPRYQSGDHLFSFTFGRTPALVIHTAKRKLDELMRRELPDLPGWQVHDLRRTLRTGLARLGLPDHVNELAIGHARKGLAGNYDRHRYVNEVRRALVLWADEVARFVSPPQPGKVVPLHGKRGE